MRWKITRGCATPSLNTRRASTILYVAGRPWYAPAVSGEEGYHSWRISADCDEFANIYEAARTMEQLSDYAGPTKGYNDPDMLVGTSTGAVTLTPTQSRTQFDLWCVLAAPLLLGTNPSRMNAWDLETYGDTEVIAIDQDPLGKQGTSPCPRTAAPHAPKDNWWCSPWSMPRDVFEVWTGLLRALAAVLLTSALLLRGAGRPRAAATAFILAVGSVGYVQVLHTYRPRVAACQQVWAKPLRRRRRGSAVCELGAGRRGRRVRRGLPR